MILQERGMKMSDEQYGRIKRIKEVRTPEEVNVLLDTDGWFLHIRCSAIGRI
jgi:hypothetical protein